MEDSLEDSNDLAGYDYSHLNKANSNPKSTRRLSFINDTHNSSSSLEANKQGYFSNLSSIEKLSTRLVIAFLSTTLVLY